MIRILKKINDLFFMLIMSKVNYAIYKGVLIGRNCRIYIRDFGSEPFLIEIGDKVTVTSGVKFITHDGTTWLMRDKRGRRHFYQKIVIGSNVFIGVNSIIMPGVKIENNVIVAAGSVVTKSVPYGVIIAGVPAKIIGKFEDVEKRMLDNYISEEDIEMDLPYRERILKVIADGYKKYLS
jgi:acetyltransferase-like isoleucine patch superfamily enzyme